MRKILIAICAAALLSACAPTQPRTGKLVVTKFEVDGFKTDNPFHVKKDAVETMRDDLHKAILKYVARDSKLSLVDGCSPDAMELTGKFDEVNAKIESHWRFVTVTVNNEFDVAVSGALRKCQTKEIIAEFDSSESDEKMSGLLEDLGENVVHQIKREPLQAAK